MVMLQDHSKNSTLVNEIMFGSKVKCALNKTENSSVLAAGQSCFDYNTKEMPYKSFLIQFGQV